MRTVSIGWPLFLFMLSLPLAIWLAGREIGQMNANAVRAQAEVQREAQAEFIKAIQAAGMEVHMEEGPSWEPRKG